VVAVVVHVRLVQVRDDTCVARGKAWRPNCKACPHGQTQPEEVKLTVDIQPGMQDGETIVFPEVSRARRAHNRRVE
jgi:DnaJ-class molecular chaperone